MNARLGRAAGGFPRGVLRRPGLRDCGEEAITRSSAPREIEIKLALRDAAAGRRLLRAAGFHVSKRRVFEANTLFDTARGRPTGYSDLQRYRGRRQVQGPRRTGSRGVRSAQAD